MDIFPLRIGGTVRLWIVWFCHRAGAVLLEALVKTGALTNGIRN